MSISASQPSSAVAALQRGQTAAQARPPRLPEALAAYDEAIAALPQHPGNDTPHLACIIHLNRGHAFSASGDHAGAVAAFQAAIDAAGSLTPATPVLLRGSAGAAWLNLAGALRSLPEADLNAVIAALSRSIDILQALPIDREPVFRRNLAGSLGHRADCRLVLQQAAGREAAETDARRALELLAPLEKQDPASADLGLKIRLIILAIGGREAPPAVTTDLAEEGLTLARDWVQRGIVGFAGPAHQLMHIAATCYQVRQPHFLAEFWREQLAPPTPAAPDAWPPLPALQTMARESLSFAWHTLQDRRLVGDSAAQERDAEALQDIAALLQELPPPQAA